jgi:hypothetical protein
MQHPAGPRGGTSGSGAVLVLVAALGLSACKGSGASGPVCTVPPGDPRAEAVETRCDGLDNDCDGEVDLLLPVEANRCSTGKPGACGQGYAQCVDGAKVCLAPPPTAETKDGIDNDCNGVVDDVPTAPAHPCRVRVLVPPYLFEESPGILEWVQTSLEQIGVPFDLDRSAADWSDGFLHLADYSLVLMPGYLIGTQLTSAQIAALRTFVEGGGVLIWTKLVGDDAGGEAVPLAGVQSVTERHDVTELRIDPEAAATLFLDSAEERSLPLPDPSLPEGSMEVFTYALQAGSGAVAFGDARAAGKSLGSAFVRRPVGAGAIYTLGFDLTEVPPQRCYVNCFDPGTDIFAMLVKGALRESCRGHTVVKHTVPGVESAVLALTHDVDAPDSHNPGKWGEPGAVQMARVEKSHGVKGTNFITTDFVAGYYNPDMVKGLCDLGICPEGGHSVQHLDMTSFVKGTCDETFASYDRAHPSACAEVRVSLELLRRVVPAKTPLIAWRQPFLNMPHDLYEVLYSQGILYDTSAGLGDVRTNFPVSLAHAPTRMDYFRALPMFVFGINIEDGIGSYNEKGEEQRIELQASNLPQFISMWSYIMLQNQANNAWNVLLVHPSYGRGVGPENLPIKMEAVGKVIEFAAAHQIRIEGLTSLGNFWRAREATSLTVSSGSAGYSGTLQTGAETAPGVSLEFGDELASFSCPGGGPTLVKGRRVVFQQALPAKTKLSFTALPR